MELVRNLAILAVSFAVLAKSASLFVDGAVGLAARFRVPRIIVGIVLVSLATTAPEFTVSVIAAFRGESAIALGNAVGSVICDDGLAVGLAGLFAATPILVQPSLLRTTGIFILVVDLLVFGFALNGVLGRLEGALFLVLLFGYFVYIVRKTRAERRAAPLRAREPHPEEKELPLGKAVFFFVGGVAGVILSSVFVVDAAVKTAALMGVPKVIVALLAVALGTSLPEVVTCIVSARKGQGELAVGNVLGADILNILWIAGMSAVVRPIHVTERQIYFMFPAMLVMVGTMLLLMRLGYDFRKWKGMVMIALYVVYLVLAVILFAGTATPVAG